MSALKCSNIVNETEMNNICIVPTRRRVSLANVRGVEKSVVVWGWGWGLEEGGREERV